ncbi:MAG: hypothetical protein U1E91_00300 [Moraxella sp.]
MTEIRQADDIVDNNGSLDDLYLKLEQLHQKYWQWQGLISAKNNKPSGL